MLLIALDPIHFPTIEALWTPLDLELHNLLSFAWLSTEAPKRQTLAIVDGGLRSPDDGGTGETIYTAAEALGIDMIVLDSPGHWLDCTRYRHWYKSFIPFETPLHPDAGYTNRIVNAVRSYPGKIDGLVTFRDQYKVAVAEAAVQLGLFTDPPQAFEIATNKFKTSVIEGHHAFQASSIEQAAKIVHEHHLDFPLIIKPCNGFLSEGVFRAENISQLETGVQSINTDRHGVKFVLEKYCKGPEVDANVVLCAGELLFFEASDDFPKSADASGHGSVETFIELANVLPSKLPQCELTNLRDSLHRSLLRMGFRDGLSPGSASGELKHGIRRSKQDLRLDRALYASQSGAICLADRSQPATAGDSRIRSGAIYQWRRLFRSRVVVWSQR